MWNSRTGKLNLCLKRRKRRKTGGGRRGKGEEKRLHLGKRIDWEGALSGVNGNILYLDKGMNYPGA